MAGADPHRHAVGAVAFCGADLGKTHAGLDFNALHAEHKNFILKVQRGKLAHQRAQTLRMDGDHDDVAVRRRAKIGRQRECFGHRDKPV